MAPELASGVRLLLLVRCGSSGERESGERRGGKGGGSFGRCDARSEDACRSR